MCDRHVTCAVRDDGEEAVATLFVVEQLTEDMTYVIGAGELSCPVELVLPTELRLSW
jgi:hypothetical protein